MNTATEHTNADTVGNMPLMPSEDEQNLFDLAVLADDLYTTIKIDQMQLYIEQLRAENALLANQNDQLMAQTDHSQGTLWLVHKGRLVMINHYCSETVMTVFEFIIWLYISNATNRYATVFLLQYIFAAFKFHCNKLRNSIFFSARYVWKARYSTLIFE